MGGSTLASPADEKRHFTETPQRWNQPSPTTGLSNLSAPSCPHSYSAGGPACWDCVQATQFNTASGAPASGADGVGRWTERNTQYEDHSSSGGSTLGKPTDLPEWRAPEAGLEAMHPDSIPLTAYQSEAPERYSVVPGLEVAQNDTVTTVPFSTKESLGVATVTAESTAAQISQQEVEGQNTSGSDKVFVLRRKTLCWALVCIILLIVATALGVALGLTLRSRSSGGSNTTGSINPSSTASESTTASTLFTTGSPLTTGSSATGPQATGSSATGSSATGSSVTGTPVPDSSGMGSSSAGSETTSSLTTEASTTGTSITDTSATKSVTSSTATGAGETEPTGTLTSMPSCTSAVNGTIYTDPTTQITFLRECGADYAGSDISHHEAYSMDDCVASCAQMDECKGVTWLNAVKQGTLNDYCWLHSEMVKSSSTYSYNTDAQSATKTG